jgi:hypothetical protein
MKFLKKSQLNFRNVKDDSVAVQISKEVMMDTPNALRLPKGTSLQRPGTVGSINSPESGHIRYNTTTDEVEVYQSSAWRSLRYKESIGIIQQDLGAGDDVERFFGPIVPAPAELVDTNQAWIQNAAGNTITPGDVWTGANMIVLVENVMQLYWKNYKIVQNPCRTTGNVISFSSVTRTITSNNTAVVDFVERGFYTGQTIVITGSTSNNKTLTIDTVTQSTIVVVETGVSGLVTESANASVTIIANSSPTGPAHGAATPGTPYPTGYYIKFDDAVPYNGTDPKYVTVLHGFDR